MSDRSREFNPFYVLVVLVGVAFVATALLDVTSLVVAQRSESGDTPPIARSPVMQFFNERGELLLLWEGGALGIVSGLAMGLDRWRRGRSARPRTQTGAAEES